MRTFISVLLLILGLFVGGMIGYSLGTINMQEEAIVEGHVTWSRIETDGEYYGTDGTNQKFGLQRKHSFEFKWN